MHLHPHTLCILIFAVLFDCSWTAEETQDHGKFPKVMVVEPEGRALFNPRIEYDQWMPVGHSDPLKNDPTFDYSPPTLDRVRYWADGDAEYKDETENGSNDNVNEKSEILLLGVRTRHKLHSHNNINQVNQIESKASNRRSSPYYPPEPSRVLTPPPIQLNSLPLDQLAYSSDYNFQLAPTNYWNIKNEVPSPHPDDALIDESASYVTVIKPKTKPSPYLATSPSVYKNVRNSVYNFAANVNSLEPIEKKPWLQSLLQSEVNYLPPSTTPQVVLAYSPKIFEAHSTHLNDIKNQQPFTATEINAQLTSTTLSPITMTTDELFSHYKQPMVPVRGIMYLIIQGHSKVKTYGVDTDNGNSTTPHAKMVPVAANKDPVVTHVVSEDERGNEIEVKHLHKTHSDEKYQVKDVSVIKNPTKTTNSTMDNLLSLLNTSFAGFFLGDTEAKSKPSMKEKNSNSVTFGTKGNGKNVPTIRTVYSPIVAPTTVKSLDSGTTILQDIS